MVDSPHSELRELLVGLNERLPAGPWFYEPGIPDGGDRTGSVWARYGDSLDLVMSKPNVATAERLVVLRNALPEIISLFEQLEAMQRERDHYRARLQEAGDNWIIPALDALASQVCDCGASPQDPIHRKWCALVSSPASRLNDESRPEGRPS